MHNKSHYTYFISDEVRDYECDLQGIVNNAEYLHYFEHARNKCIKLLGYTLGELHQRNEDPVVARIEVDFKYPLRSGDVYYVCTKIAQNGKMRLMFYQTIFSNPAVHMTSANASISTSTSTNANAEQDTPVIQTQKSRPIHKEELRFAHLQEIPANSRIHASAVVTVAVLSKGKPISIEKSFFSKFSK